MYDSPHRFPEMLGTTGRKITLVILFFASGLAGAHSQEPVGSSSAKPSDPRLQPMARNQYVGDEACRACHQELVDSYFQTAHHQTSRIASKSSVAGKFAPGTDKMSTADPGLSFLMDERGDGFYETAIWGLPPVTTSRSERMDLVIGSARKGQTYLFWSGDRLYQLPVSYWVEIDQWVNSPGYRDGVADFHRPVIPRCFECHASYIQSLPGPPPPNRYARNSLLLGISCERCHGPGSGHVSSRRSKENPLGENAIINPQALSRERQIDICAQCHAGHGAPLAAPFSYVPGEPLDDYLKREQSDPMSDIDVHGNQVALLERSRCYQHSDSMTCSTCHDVHVPQRNSKDFSSRCLVCHKTGDCRASSRLESSTSFNCVDCHMPVQVSKQIIAETQGKKIAARVRNHWIRIYPDSQLP
jgi:hypothetical protein